MFGSRPSDQRSASPISTIGVLNPGNVQMPDRFTQNTVLMGKGAPHYQAQELHPQVKEHSCRSCEDGMEVDGGSPQCNISRSPAIFGSSERVSTENMQASGGLMRYHSAPSSMLSSLVDVGEDFLSQVSSPLSNTGDAEFAELFVDDLNTATTLCDKRALQQTHKSQMGSVMNGEQLLSEHRDRGRMITQQTIYKRPLINGKVDDVNRAPLSAIFEHGPDVPLGSFCNSQISGTCKQEASQTDHIVGMGSLVSEGNSCNPLVIPGTSFGSLPHTRGHLIRHSSSPAGLLSRLAMDVQSEMCERPNPCFSGPKVLQPAECSPQSVSKERCFSSAGRGPGLVSGFSERNSFGANRASAEIIDDLLTNDGHLGVPSPSSRSSLVRQSSSPAGLLSQLSLDGIVEGEEKVIMPSSSENHADEGSFDRRGGPAAFLDSYQVGSWDEQINAAGGVMLGMQYDTAFAARKRVRELEAKMFPGLTLPDSQLRDDSELGASLANQFCITPTTSPDNGLSTEKFPLDYVPLRARAKRGCATHPRSIAERVRRTKISERMRKLQDLVPNMDKQTNTADMLDEAVEYVKLLQRQVKELSENRPKCDGSCRQNK